MRSLRDFLLRWRLRSILVGLFVCSAGSGLQAGEVDTQFHLRWAWSEVGSRIGTKGLEVVDLDSDGDAEILVAADPGEAGGYWYVLERHGGALVQVYSSLPRADGVAGVAAGIANGEVNIVVAGGSALIVHDGATRGELASFPVYSTTQQALAVADLDGNGILDAVVCDDENLYVYELLTGTVRTKFGFGCIDIDIGQTDSDPQLEIALAGNSAGGFILDGASLFVDWADLRGFGERVCFGDFDADGYDEVASQITEWGGVRVQDPETGTLLWEEPEADAAALAAGELDEEPGSELLWGGRQWGDVYVLDGDTSVQLRVIENSGYEVRSIAIGDTNGDGITDVLWGSGESFLGPSTLFVTSGDGTEFEAQTEEMRAPFSGAAVGDFRGDGSLEVASVSAPNSSEHSGGIPVVLALDSGRLLRFGTSTISAWSQYLPVAMTSGQMDTDLQLEICVAGVTTLGCLDGADFAEQWFVEMNGTPFALRSGELDGDPFPELVVGSAGNLVFAFEGDTGWLKWRSPDPPTSYQLLDRVRLLDLQGDARQEVVVSNAEGPGAPMTTYDGFSGLVEAGPWAADVLSLDVPFAGPAPETLLVGQASGSIVPFDPLTGVAGAAIATFSEGVAAIGIADFDRDGTLDVAALLENHFEIRSGETGATLFTSPYLGHLAGTAESFLVGDFDRDTVPEILVGTGAGLALFEAPLFSIFADGFESGSTSNW